MIVFQAKVNGNREIFVINADGSNLSQITNDPASDAFMSWHPDGEQLVFFSNRSGHEELYTMRVNGSNVAPITTADARVMQPVWSPDGDQLVFVSDRDGDNELYLLDMVSGEEINLTDNPAYDATPRWSPDGSKIAFSSDRDGEPHIYLMDLASGEITRLTYGPGYAAFPAWSPDGSRIAFHAERGNNTDIYVMDDDGRNVTRLTRDLATDGSPTWSADGRHIAFVSTRGGETFGLYVIDIEGNNPIALTSLEGDVEYPSWSPASNSMARSFPLPTPVLTARPTLPPQIETPVAGEIGSGCPISGDPSYGYTPENSIKVGGGPFGGGPSREYAYLEALRGPAGQDLVVENRASLEFGDVFLDDFTVTYEGYPGSFSLYLNIYEEAPRLAPAGLICGVPLP